MNGVIFFVLEFGCRGDNLYLRAYSPKKYAIEKITIGLITTQLNSPTA